MRGKNWTMNRKKAGQKNELTFHEYLNLLAEYVDLNFYSFLNCFKMLLHRIHRQNIIATFIGSVDYEFISCSRSFSN